MMNILEVFSLFSIVQFPNDECATNDINVKTGVCTTSTECTDNSGVESGTCASGFGGKIQFSRWMDEELIEFQFVVSTRQVTAEQQFPGTSPTFKIQASPPPTQQLGPAPTR